MLQITDIEKLAKLARIDLTDEQKASYLKEIGAILAYVDQIKEVAAKVGSDRNLPDLRNVSRSDEDSNQSSTQTDDLVAEFPKKEGNYLKVKKILEN